MIVIQSVLTRSAVPGCRGHYMFLALSESIWHHSLSFHHLNGNLYLLLHWLGGRPCLRLTGVRRGVRVWVPLTLRVQMCADVSARDRIRSDLARVPLHGLRVGASAGARRGGARVLIEAVELLESDLSAVEDARWIVRLAKADDV